MKKALLLDTNLSSAPIYNYLVDMGLAVYVIGNNPQDSLAKSCSHYIKMDYSDTSKIAEYMNNLKIDYLIPGCNDQSYMVCAKLNSNNRYFGIDSLITTDILNKKDIFRKISKELDLPSPKIITGDITDEKYPIIIKPIDAYSGRGTTVIKENDSSKLEIAINYAINFSKSGKYIIEEYVKGQLYSHSAFIEDGEIVVDFIVEEFGVINEFAVDTSRVIFDFPIKILNNIRDCIYKLIRTYNLGDGLIHTQFIMNNDKFWLIEITRRCPGDLYSQLIELSTGFKYAEVYTKPFLQQKLFVSNYIIKKDFIIRHTVSQAIESNIESLTFNFPINLIKMIPMCISGDLIKPSPFGRIALLFLKSDSEREHMELYEKILNKNLYSVDKRQ